MSTSRLINQLRAIERAPEFTEALKTEHEFLEDIENLETLVSLLKDTMPKFVKTLVPLLEDPGPKSAETLKDLLGNPSPEFVQTLKKILKPRYAESDLRETLNILKTKLKQRYAKYLFAEGLDNLRQVDSQKGAYPTIVTFFLSGMMVSFGGLIRMAEQLTAKGEPELEAFLRKLRVDALKRDLRDLQLVTLDNLLRWKSLYPPFLMGLRLSLYCRRRMGADQSPEVLAWYDGIWALVSWVVKRATGQNLPKNQKK